MQFLPQSQTPEPKKEGLLSQAIGGLLAGAVQGGSKEFTAQRSKRKLKDIIENKSLNAIERLEAVQTTPGITSEDQKTFVQTQQFQQTFGKKERQTKVSEITERFKLGIKGLNDLADKEQIETARNKMFEELNALRNEGVEVPEGTAEKILQDIKKEREIVETNKLKKINIPSASKSEQLNVARSKKATSKIAGLSKKEIPFNTTNINALNEGREAFRQNAIENLVADKGWSEEKAAEIVDAAMEKGGTNPVSGRSVYFLDGLMERVQRGNLSDQQIDRLIKAKGGTDQDVEDFLEFVQQQNQEQQQQSALASNQVTQGLINLIS